MSDQLYERLGRIEEKLHGLVGNGQPGRIGLIEKQLGRHDRFINRIIGFGVAMNMLLVVAEAIRMFGR